MKLTNISGVTAMAAALFTLFLMPSYAAAIEAEETVLVFPGQEYAELTLPEYASITALAGSHHGRAVEEQGRLLYYPDDNFWIVGSDVTLANLASSRKGERQGALRIRWVAGQTAYDNRPVGMRTGDQYEWLPWQLPDSSNNGFEILAGIVASHAYRFTLADEQSDHAVMAGMVRRDVIDLTTTTSEVSAVIDDIEPWNEWNKVGDITIFQWRQNQYVLGELILQVDGGDPNPLTNSPPTCRVKPRSSMDPSAIGDLLNLGYNTLRLVRYDGPYSSGAQFFVNDILVDTIQVEHSIPDIPEIHELMLTATTASPWTISFEDPTTRSSDQVIDPTTRLIYDDFSLASSTDKWSIISNPAAMDTRAQDLPGPGHQLDINLDQLGKLQSSYLEKSLSPNIGTGLRPQGYGLRYWFDPTALTMPQGDHISLVAACPASGACGALRMQLGRDAKGLFIAASAADDDGQVARVSTHITQQPHDIQVRLKNGAGQGIATGWLELWVDGKFAGRQKALRNHGQQLQLVRFGALGKPAGASGVLGLDEFEAWRFN